MRLSVLLNHVARQIGVSRWGDLRTIVVESSSCECFTDRDNVRMSDARPVFNGAKRGLIGQSKICSKKLHEWTKTEDNPK